MDHGKFESKINEIYSLIMNNCTPVLLADFLDKEGQDLKDYLVRNEDWSHLDCNDPLSEAAWNGRAEILGLLLSKYGMGVNARCERGNYTSTNALAVAIAHNQVACVRVLLKHGADTEIGGCYCSTPFENAQDLDRLCEAGKISGHVTYRDDSIKNILEEEAARRRGGERDKKKEGNKQLPDRFFFSQFWSFKT